MVSPCVSNIRMGSVATKGRTNVVLRVSTGATKMVVVVRNHITFAHTPTDSFKQVHVVMNSIV